jgi:hypothetical protein
MQRINQRNRILDNSHITKPSTGKEMLGLKTFEPGHAAIELPPLSRAFLQLPVKSSLTQNILLQTSTITVLPSE